MGKATKPQESPHTGGNRMSEETDEALIARVHANNYFDWEVEGLATRLSQANQTFA